ncbi:FUSC family protein [Streptomyces sulfonofaciens]|uniref:FUSC family protein n=1 Tax=Streptomyces sulfonofaciens TaxID=68272 RepID=A0A919GAB8_9ACTN|nr:FUSC family protein [Streptomyces sulfonofaciens]GHH81002.1 FUSC family protein [Streptomyces sulfonofaciens]
MTSPGTARQEADRSTGARPAAAVPIDVAPRRAGGPHRWWDRVLAADPGLGQLQAGWRTLVAMVTSLAVGYGLARALAIPPMIGMMVAGMMGLMSAFAVSGNSWSQLAKAILWMPFPFSAVLWAAAALHGDRALEIGLNAAALALTFLLARFGQVALLTGMMLFNGLLVGTIAGIPAALVGKAFLVALVSAAAVLATRLLLCYPMPRRDLLRTQRAFVVEARRVVDATVDALDPDADLRRVERRMNHSLRRLNIVTVTIDGRLAQPEAATDPAAAELLHRHLFDVELVLRGIGQAVRALAAQSPPEELRRSLAVGLLLARDTPPAGAGGLRPAVEVIRGQADTILRNPGADPRDAESAALARRVAELLDSLADSLASWLTLGQRTPKAPAAVPFTAAVALENNRIPGSAVPMRRVLTARTESGWQRVVPFVRAPLHAAVAAAIVCPIADAIDPQRFYWGLIGVMITLFGTNTTHERLRKFGHRMVGTAAGAVIGVLLLHWIGHHHVYWMLTVIVLGLSLGSWGMQRAYALWTTGLVVALVQLYGLTTPDSGMSHLLGERLVDNGIGILVASACAALIFPLSNRAIVREAEHGYLQAVQNLLTQVSARWEEPDSPVRLRGAARAVDVALFQVAEVSRPLVRMPLGVRGRAPQHRTALLTTAAGHARALAAAADVDIDLSPRLSEGIQRITHTFADSLRALEHHLANRTAQGAWRRVGPFVRELRADLRPAAPGPRAQRLRTALHELEALDGVLAAFAEECGLPLASDTGREPGRPDPGLRPAPVSATARGGPRPVQPPAARSAGAGVPAGAPGPARTDDTAAVPLSGSVCCAAHPGGCSARITVINARSQRVAQTYTDAGRYRLSLRPGSHTLVVSAADHPPRAQSVMVRAAQPDLLLDIRL